MHHDRAAAQPLATTPAGMRIVLRRCYYRHGRDKERGGLLRVCVRRDNRGMGQHSGGWMWKSSQTRERGVLHERLPSYESCAALEPCRWREHSPLGKDFAKIAEQVERASGRARVLYFGLDRLDSASTVYVEGKHGRPVWLLPARTPRNARRAVSTRAAGTLHEFSGGPLGLVLRSFHLSSAKADRAKARHRHLGSEPGLGRTGLHYPWLA